MNTDRFKFRAWDKGWKQMVYPDVIHHNINLGCTIHSAFKPSDGKGYFPIQENLTLMQCTGLKDSEGRLIYEGDLLIMSKHSDGKSCEVTWNAGCYCCFPFGTLEAALPYCKIVGNIYETVQK